MAKTIPLKIQMGCVGVTGGPLFGRSYRGGSYAVDQPHMPKDYEKLGIDRQQT